jgi:type I restriction enzyme S subunit
MRIKDKVDKDNTELEYYIGGEHFDNGEICITKRGIIKESTIGPAFHMRFKPGDVLLMSRNPHLRKAGVVDFEGICSDVSYVCRTRDENVLMQRFLPFIFQTDAFWKFAEENKGGSTNFFLNWSDFERYEFDLPSIEEQRQLTEILWAAQNAKLAYKELLRQTDELVKSQFIELFGDPELALKSTHTVSEVADVQVGIVIKPTRYYADGVEGTKAFRSLNVGTMCVNDADWVYFSDDAMKETQRTVARTGDVLIVRSGNPGTSCVVTPEYDGCNVIDLIIAHPIKDKILPEYLCAFTNYPHGMNQIIGQQRGVAQKHFNVGLYNQMKIILPTLEEQRRFVAILKQTDKSKFVAYQETIFIEKILKYTYNHTFRRKNNVH